MVSGNGCTTLWVHLMPPNCTLFTKTGCWPSGHSFPTPDLNFPLVCWKGSPFLCLIHLCYCCCCSCCHCSVFHSSMKLCTPNIACVQRKKKTICILWGLQFFLEVVHPDTHSFSISRSRNVKYDYAYKNDHRDPKTSGDRLELVSTLSGRIYKTSTFISLAS